MRKSKFTHSTHLYGSALRGILFVVTLLMAITYGPIKSFRSTKRLGDRFLGASKKWRPSNSDQKSLGKTSLHKGRTGEIVSVQVSLDQYSFESQLLFKMPRNEITQTLTAQFQFFRFTGLDPPALCLAS